MGAGNNLMWNVNQLTLRRRAIRPEAEILYAAYYGYGNEPFLSCCREVEDAIEARRKRIPRDPPKFPLTTVSRAGPAGRYRLVDNHGTWGQQLSFAHPVAACLFIRAFRASGQADITTIRRDPLAQEREAIESQ
jgi:hypothetical protein